MGRQIDGWIYTHTLDATLCLWWTARVYQSSVRGNVHPEWFLRLKIASGRLSSSFVFFLVAFLSAKVSRWGCP